MIRRDAVKINQEKAGIVQNGERWTGLALARLEVFLQRLPEATGLPGGFAVALVSDAEIREMNRRFRKQDQATDVLSFPAMERTTPSPIQTTPWRGVEPRHGAASFRGDIAISVETAVRQAGRRGHSLEREIRLLALHGYLHLCGYDHERDGGAMRLMESRLRRKLRLPEGLVERSRRRGANGRKP